LSPGTPRRLFFLEWFQRGDATAVARASDLLLKLGVAARFSAARGCSAPPPAMPDDASDPHTHAAMAEATAAIVAAEPLPAVLERAAWRALGGGLAGGVAMLGQVAMLMPARTLMTVQMRRGGGAWDATRALFKEGGVRRFYAGVGPALIQAPLSRFGDTASNAGALALLGSLEATRSLPIALQTLAASLTAAAFRVLLTPLDILKVRRAQAR